MNGNANEYEREKLEKRYWARIEGGAGAALLVIGGLVWFCWRFLFSLALPSAVLLIWAAVSWYAPKARLYRLLWSFVVAVAGAVGMGVLLDLPREPWVRGRLTTNEVSLNPHGALGFNGILGDCDEVLVADRDASMTTPLIRVEASGTSSRFRALVGRSGKLSFSGASGTGRPLIQVEPGRHHSVSFSFDFAARSNMRSSVLKLDLGEPRNGERILAMDLGALTGHVDLAAAEFRVVLRNCVVKFDGAAVGTVGDDPSAEEAAIGFKSLVTTESLEIAFAHRTENGQSVFQFIIADPSKGHSVLEATDALQVLKVDLACDACSGTLQTGAKTALNSMPQGAIENKVEISEIGLKTIGIANDGIEPNVEGDVKHLSINGEEQVAGYLSVFQEHGELTTLLAAICWGATFLFACLGLGEVPGQAKKGSE